MSDLTGQRFGRLLVVSKQPGFGLTKYMCACDCGKTHIARGAHMSAGRTKSCGCLSLELSLKRATTHGLTRTPEYKAWCNIRARCQDPKNNSYKYYGQRGIAVCERWSVFTNFLSDMGRRPTADHSIDRKDSNGDYAPDNCKWSTEVEQQNNRRNNKLLTSRGITMSETAWARMLGIKQQKLNQRINRGWSVERALTQR